MVVNRVYRNRTRDGAQLLVYTSLDSLLLAYRPVWEIPWNVSF